MAESVRVAMLEIITMSPRGSLRMFGMTRLQRLCEPKAWVETTRISSLGSVSTTDKPRLAIPALLTRMLIGPKSLSMICTIASTRSYSATVARYMRALPPLATISSTVARAASSSRR